MKGKKILPKTSKYQDFNKNEFIFARKSTVKADIRGNKRNLPMHNTKRENIKPLHGMDWLRKYNWTTRNIESRKYDDYKRPIRKDKISTNFEKLSETNRNIKDTRSKNN